VGKTYDFSQAKPNPYAKRAALASTHGIAHNTIEVTPRVVLDTNVLVAASRSKRGASAKLLSLVGTGLFEICISVPLILEYESAVLRDVEPNSTEWKVRTDILDYLCGVAAQQQIFFLWRPYLRDPKDEMVLEVAVAGGCSAIISYNKRDFAGSERFHLVISSPKEFLDEIGALT
jgi:putative PIN family toxin of toxin-antitoxin system